MNKNRKMVIVFLFAFVLCFSLAGCTLQDRIEEYSSGKEQCYLNTENVTRFSYKGNNYTILADTVSNGGLGEWIGYIRQLAAIDENGKILLQENVESATFQSLADLAEKAPEAAYIIPFLNVYAAPNADDYLIVDVNGGYHKAVISENVKDSDTVFDFKKTEESINDSFEVNPENATQLLWGGTVYQVTSDMVSDDELGSYIDILAESVTFDTETKIPLSKEDLSKIDWYGKNGGQGRESWFYTDVYEIYGTDKACAILKRTTKGGNNMAAILMIDDERAILELVKNGLRKDGHFVTAYTSAAQVPLDKLNRYDLIILDIMMPDVDGFSYCDKIRSLVDCPILFLTAKTMEHDITFGLGLGADDYLTKPFRIAELRARVNAHLRRERRERHTALTFDRIKIDLSAKELRVDNTPVALTKSEYLICEYLARNKGQVFSKEQIYEAVFSLEGDSDNSTISTHIKNIRSKLNKLDIQPIATVWGIGYKWE